jgi:hypothetical protein
MSARRSIELSELDGNLIAEGAILLDALNLKIWQQSRISLASRSEIAIRLAPL